jgi:hypothetical protein
MGSSATLGCAKRVEWDEWAGEEAERGEDDAELDVWHGNVIRWERCYEAALHGIRSRAK